MNDLKQFYQTEILDNDECLILSKKLVAINNEVRFTILKILRDFEKIHGLNKDPLYSREINVFLTNFNINITPQMLGQHLKILVEAGLLEEVMVKKEIPNKIGRRNVKAYIIKPDAFTDLFLDINFFSEELLGFFELYDVHKKFQEKDCCLITIFNGKDKGKTFKINKDDVVFIGRKANFNHDDFENKCIFLDNEYKSVSSVSKPHLKLFYEDNWCIIDDVSSNGTFIGDKQIPTGVKVNLKNKSFIKLSKGNGGAVIYCSF